MEPLDANACYQALCTHDARFDGVFFVGVRSTGIYCRPVCPAKTPKEENCTFYPHAASAEQAGFRPCLRCRPELAPGNTIASVDAFAELARRAASRIEDGALSEKSMTELAEELGVSERHLRRVVVSAFGVSPIALAQTQHLLLAKRLLTDTHLPITQIAFASGFASVRRFNHVFQERYRLTPTDLRRNTNRTEVETLTVSLGFHQPFAWSELLAFLSHRTLVGVEAVLDQTYCRTVQIGEHTGWLKVAATEQTLQVTLSHSLALALPQTLARVKRLFDLTADPLPIATHLGALAENCPGLRVPGAFHGFETAVRAILGQQVSVKAATTLASRFVAALGEPIATPFTALTHLSPTAERVAQTSKHELIALGILESRATAILTLAQAVSEGRLNLEPGGNIPEKLAQLQALPGIGEWTAQYIAMRALAWPDAFPHTDLGVKKALGLTTPKAILTHAERWQPWRAYAVMHLWRSLETNDTEKPL
ncbi:DNA-3-methyladenine glycosylase 2 [Armatimonas sp.]|uniref:DNA-3-methyladenine glycosylase 2 n=1 Tax=Armatimonas sp. TaxID=1872638 RepID=UPI00286B3E09|nr:DNA-3-methyladenine glycosylase 2 [Armatimonas sp.]